RALLKRGLAAFDELKQGIRDIAFLADPSVGELRIGAPEALASGILPQIVQRFFYEYPGVKLDVEGAGTHAMLGRLRERSLDLVMALDDSLLRVRADPAIRGLGDDLEAETLFHDELVVVAGPQSRWRHRRKIDLAELRQEPWI